MSARLGAGFRRAGEGAGKRAEFASSPAPAAGRDPPPGSQVVFPEDGGNLCPVVVSRTPTAGGGGAFQLRRYLPGQLGAPPDVTTRSRMQRTTP